MLFIVWCFWSVFFSVVFSFVVVVFVWCLRMVLDGVAVCVFVLKGGHGVLV